MEHKTETKQAIRRRIIELRNQIPFPLLEEKSECIINKVLTDDACRNAKYAAVYVDYRNEVITRYLIATLLEQGKLVYCPKIVGEEMQFFQITSLKELHKGYQGIWEPEAKEENLFAINDKNLIKDSVMIMPGVAFTKEGNRLGYGKGFYDRFLQKLPNLKTIAVCLDCQLVEEIPIESTDILPHKLYTESYQFERERKEYL